MVLFLPLAGCDANPQTIAQKKGEFAFHYAARYTPGELAWYSRFKVVVTGDFLPPDQVRTLHRAGCKLIAYEWTVAFYAPDSISKHAWQRKLVEDHPDWLLNASKGLYGNAGAADIPAFYYDPVSTDLRKWRVAHLVQDVKTHNYDGVFFDTTGFTAVQHDAQEEFKRRHPNERYDEYVGQFLDGLRKCAPDLITFTNQGYRNAEDYLPRADYDLSESYMTTTDGPQADVYVEGKGPTRVTETYVHPWDDPDHPWDSVAHYCKVLINDPIAHGGYKARVCHLNYGQPRYEPTGQSISVDGQSLPVFRETLDREALYYSAAAAALMNQDSYFVTPDGIPADRVYFANLGKPTTDNYSYDETTHIATRTFANGFAAVNAGSQARDFVLSASAIPAGVTGLWDVFAGREVGGFLKRRTVTLPVSHYTATQRTAPAGRIFLYMRPKSEESSTAIAER